MADLSGIVFDDDVSAVGTADVEGFFEGWPQRFGMLQVSGMVMRNPAAL